MSALAQGVALTLPSLVLGRLDANPLGLGKVRIREQPHGLGDGHMDRPCLGIDPAITFAEKLIALKAGGWIGDTEKDILEVVTDAGNAAAHRGWSPSGREVADLLVALELFLQKAFIVGKKALGIKARIPTKPKRSVKT